MRFIIILCVIIMFATFVQADDHNSNGRKHELKYESEQNDHDTPEKNGPDETNEGDEITGQIAAGLFGAANVMIIISLLLKGLIRFFALKPEIQTSLKKFNHQQKKYLMKLHYFLNPIALSVAIIHFLLSSCPSFPLPEWGLIFTSLIVGCGLILKIKFSPRPIKKIAYKLHTHPSIFIFLISIILTGHVIMD